MKSNYAFLLCLTGIVFLSIQCDNRNATDRQSSTPNVLHNDVVFPFHLSEIRLGDGVPLNLKVNVRWAVKNEKVFLKQFADVNAFNTLILQPRLREITSQTSMVYPSVDSVFFGQREQFIDEIKEAIQVQLGGDEANVKEVIVSNIGFPETYTAAMEKVGLQKQELERIRQQSILDVAKSDAAKKKADAESKVLIAKAEADAKVQKIKARTEKDRRQNELAIAETQAQISKKQAQADAERQKVLDKANLVKQTDLKNLEIQKQKDLVNVEVERKRKEAQVDREIQLEMATMFQNNPTYASFLVNKELASKVEIAVLPTNTDGNVLGNFLNQKINKD